MLRTARLQLRSSRPPPTSLLQRPHKAARGYAAVAVSASAVTDLSRFPRVGEQLHGFTLKRLKQVPELELTALHLHHDKTGAEYLHIARDDANNCFSIGFKTNPPDDTGVPHILEHTTLCGSEKYAHLRPRPHPPHLHACVANPLSPPGTPSATPSSRCCRAPSPTS